MLINISECLIIAVIVIAFVKAIIWTIHLANRLPDLKDMSDDYAYLPHRFIDRQWIERPITKPDKTEDETVEEVLFAIAKSYRF